MVSVSLHNVALETARARRLTVLCQDVPYPATHGGKVDLWNLVRGLRDRGVAIQLVCWFTHGRIEPEVRQALARTVDDVVEIRRRGGPWRLLYARYPPRMLAFTPSRRERTELTERVRAFAPDWLLFDHWAAYLAARSLSRDLRRPLVYRSQNVEHRYYRELMRVAKGALKVKLALNARRLSAAEREIRESVDLVADISAEDRDEWSAGSGRGRSLVVPPVWIDAMPRPTAADALDIDVLFVGNLRTPNNVEGLRWFANHVLPILRARLAPHAPRIVFAGSEPDASDLSAWRRAGIQCEPNPPDVSVFYRHARVVINPVQRGSGVNLKMIEALATGRPVVASLPAVRGLPDEVRSHFTIGRTAEAFASAVDEALRTTDAGPDPADRAALVERCFGPATLHPLLDALDRLRPTCASE